MISLDLVKDKYKFKCCFNCKHHFLFNLGSENSDFDDSTLICGFGIILGRFYSSHVPCSLWDLDKMIYDVFNLNFLDSERSIPVQLTFDF